MRLHINDEFKSFPLMRKNDIYPVRIHVPAQLTKQELAFYFKYSRKDRSKAPHLSNSAGALPESGWNPAVEPMQIVHIRQLRRDISPPWKKHPIIEQSL